MNQPDGLRPVMHEKIDRMNGEELAMLQQVLENLEEAWKTADHLNDAFDDDHAKGKFQNLNELVQEFRSKHRYA